MAGKIFVVVIRVHFGGVDKQRESGGCLFGLRGVIKFEAFAGFVGRLAALEGVLQCAVEQRRRNLLLPLIGHVTDGF